jgi:hypothetical protein
MPGSRSRAFLRALGSVQDESEALQTREVVAMMARVAQK